MSSTNHQYLNLAEESAKSQERGFVRPNPTVTRVGFIDLGSNSSRLTVVEFDRRGRVTVLNRVKSMVRLGERAFETKELQPEAMDRALACLVEFAEICRSYGVTEVVAVGTAALRVAQNSIDFVNRVKERTGFDLQVISGDEEARLIRVGIWDSLPKTKDSFLFIDIGGGSTEVSVSSRDKIYFLESLNIGCVMMTDAFKGNAQGKISSSVFAKMQQRAQEKIQHILKKTERSRFKAAIASSGTAQALLNLAQAKFGEAGGFLQKEAGIELKRSQIAALAKSLSQMTSAEREKLPRERSLGCVFKNPPGHSAGELIERAGLKGMHIGGAFVSEKHANFIVNRGEATAADYRALVALVRGKVLSETGIRLAEEIRYIGEFYASDG